MNEKMLQSNIAVTDITSRNGIRHRVMAISPIDTICVQEGELVGYGDGNSVVRSSAKIAFSALYRRGIFRRGILTYAVQSFGYSVTAILMVNYEDGGLQGGVFPIMKIVGGSPEKIGPVTLPPRFDGSMILNEANITVPPNIAPSGDKYLISIAMGAQICTFIVPRNIGKSVSELNFSSEVPMAATLKELTTEPNKNVKKARAARSKGDNPG